MKKEKIKPFTCGLASANVESELSERQSVFPEISDEAELREKSFVTPELSAVPNISVDETADICPYVNTSQDSSKPFTYDHTRAKKLLTTETSSVDESNAYSEIAGKTTAGAEKAKRLEKPFIIPDESAGTDASGNYKLLEKPFIIPEIPAVPNAFGNEAAYKNNATTAQNLNLVTSNQEDRERIVSPPTDVQENSTAGNARTSQATRTMQFVPADNVLQGFTLHNFIFDGEILRYIDAKSKSEIEICNFAIRIDAEITRIHDFANEQGKIMRTEEDTTWKVTVFCEGNGRTAELNFSDLSNDKKISTLTRDRGYIASDVCAKRFYKKYMQMLLRSHTYEHYFLFECSGWRKIEGNWKYLTNLGIIGGSALYRADVDYRFAFNPALVGTDCAFKNFWQMRELCCQRRENSVFLMHFACLATMTTLFAEAGYSVNFVVALVGATNSQKTSTGAVFAKMFDRTKYPTADLQFRSSEVAIMERMEKYGDAILFIDDLLPYTDMCMAREQKKKLETVVRSYGDRIARTRSKVFASINHVPQFTPVKGCCMISGEILETNSESSTKRLVQLVFNTGDVNLNLLKYYQENPDLYGSFLYDFIRYAGDNIAMIFSIIKEEVEKARATKRAQIETPRYVDALGIMAASTRVFYSYAIARGFLSTDEASVNRSNDLTLIENIIIKNDIESKVETPSMTLYLSLQYGMLNHLVRVCTLEEGKNFSSFENVILYDEKYFYMLSDTLYNLYSAYCRTRHIENIYKNGRELTALLKKDNAILIKKEGSVHRSAHKLNLPTCMRFLFLKKSVFSSFTEAYNEF